MVAPSTSREALPGPGITLQDDGQRLVLTLPLFDPAGQLARGDFLTWLGTLLFLALCEPFIYVMSTWEPPITKRHPNPRLEGPVGAEVGLGVFNAMLVSAMAFGAATAPRGFRLTLDRRAGRFELRHLRRVAAVCDTGFLGDVVGVRASLASRPGQLRASIEYPTLELDLANGSTLVTPAVEPLPDRWASGATSLAIMQGYATECRRFLALPDMEPRAVPGNED